MDLGYLVSGLIAALARPLVAGLLALGDRPVSFLLGCLAWLARGEARALLREVQDVFRRGPPHSDLVRRIVAESRFEELRDYLWGSLFLKRSGAGLGGD